MIGPDHVDRVRLGLDRDIQEVAAVVFLEADRPDRADVLRQCGLARLPVHQVAAVPDRQARIGIEAGEGHVIVRAVLQDGGIGMVSGDQRIEKATVAKIGHPLAVEATPPVVLEPLYARIGLGRLRDRGGGRHECDRTARQCQSEGLAAVIGHAHVLF
jgi:hypothetical protein